MRNFEVKQFIVLLLLRLFEIILVPFIWVLCVALFFFFTRKKWYWAENCFYLGFICDFIFSQLGKIVLG
jgi:hypothetical protein